MSAPAGARSGTGSSAIGCRICGETEGLEPLRVREMMFGTREGFDYQRCPRCGCLQIAQIPSDLARHYPSAYFSFRPPRGRRWLRARIDPQRLRAALGEGSSLVGRAANALAKPLDFARWLRAAGLPARASVLDVGCGAGKLVSRMSTAGLGPCVGIDPYLAGDHVLPGGARLRARTLASLAAASDERFDLVMFHHALEHLSDPGAALADAARLLSDRGTVLVRVPVADSFAFAHYREHWVQLDAPRHLHLPTRDGMVRLAERAGLEVRRVEYDSTALQFVGSERYRRDVPLSAAGGPRPSRRTLADYDARAVALNAAGQGDQAAFYLAKLTP